MNRIATTPARLVVHATLILAALWVLVAMLTWGSPAEGPRVSTPWTTLGYGQSALFEEAVQLAPILGIVVLNIAAGLIGWRLVTAPVWGRVMPGAPHWLALAGVVPGGMICLVIARVVTLGLDHAIAPLVIAVTIAGLVLYAIRDLLRARRTATPGSTGFRWWMLWACAAAVFASLVFQVHIDRGHALAEGSIWFIQNMFLSSEHGVGTDGRMPIVSQHYDEAAFLYPVVYGLLDSAEGASSTLTAVYWIYLAISRAALVALTYASIRGFALDRFSAITVTAFTCFASMSLNPFTSHVLFDSLSPMAYVFHAARFLVPILPMLVVSAWLNVGEARPGAQTAFVALALGMALAAMPVHAAALVPWTVALVVLVLATGTGAATSRFRNAAALAALAILAAATFAYGLQSAPDILRVGVLVAAPAAAGLWIVWTGWSARKAVLVSGAHVRSVLVATGWAFAGNMIAFMFFGNVLAHDLIPIVGAWGDMPIIDRLAGSAVKPALAIEASAWCAAGYEWGYRTLLGHCGSLAMFARTYGLAFVLIALVLALRAARPVAASARPEGEAIINWSLALCLLALPVSFAVFDFVAPSASSIEWERSLSIWLRSRLIEPWFVSGIVIALAVLLREASSDQRRWGQIILLGSAAIFALNPLTLPAQFVANAGYLVTRLLGGG